MLAPVRIAVACSGGRDSMALLHATVRLAHELGGTQVVALHVHHGLSTHADDWLALVQGACSDWAAQGWPVLFDARRLSLALKPGDSLEAVARRARYEALAEMAVQAGCESVLLGHHRQDQAETFLLQALRGAGVAGLAAMPRESDRHGLTWLRPWLNHPRSSIEAYVAEHGISHVDDDSNGDVRHARNRLRLQVWPALSTSFAQAEASLAQAASHQADVLDCLNDWLADKLPQLTCASPASGADEASTGVALVVQDWRALPDGQQRQILRAWFVQATGLTLPMSWVQRLHAQIRGASGRWCLRLTGATGAVFQGEVVFYRGLLKWHPLLASSLADVDGWPEDGWPLAIHGAGLVPVPQAQGDLVVKKVDEGGLPLSRLAHCALRRRVGSEQFQLALNRPARSLKKQFQGQAVPAWERQGPLLWSGDDLLFVPGLGIDARALAGPEEAQVMLSWRPWLAGV